MLLLLFSFEWLYVIKWSEYCDWLILWISFCVPWLKGQAQSTLLYAIICSNSNAKTVMLIFFVFVGLCWERGWGVEDGWINCFLHNVELDVCLLLANDLQILSWKGFVTGLYSPQWACWGQLLKLLLIFNCLIRFRSSSKSILLWSSNVWDWLCLWGPYWSKLWQWFYLYPLPLLW